MVMKKPINQRRSVLVLILILYSHPQKSSVSASEAIFVSRQIQQNNQCGEAEQTNMPAKVLISGGKENNRGDEEYGGVADESKTNLKPRTTTRPLTPVLSRSSIAKFETERRNFSQSLLGRLDHEEEEDDEHVDDTVTFSPVRFDTDISSSPLIQNSKGKHRHSAGDLLGLKQAPHAVAAGRDDDGDDDNASCPPRVFENDVNDSQTDAHYDLVHWNYRTTKRDHLDDHHADDDQSHEFDDSDTAPAKYNDTRDTMAEITSNETIKAPLHKTSVGFEQNAADNLPRWKSDLSLQTNLYDPLHSSFTDQSLASLLSGVNNESAIQKGLYGDATASPSKYSIASSLGSQRRPQQQITSPAPTILRKPKYSNDTSFASSQNGRPHDPPPFSQLVFDTKNDTLQTSTKDEGPNTSSSWSMDYYDDDGEGIDDNRGRIDPNRQDDGTKIFIDEAFRLRRDIKQLQRINSSSKAPFTIYDSKNKSVGDVPVIFEAAISPILDVLSDIIQQILSVVTDDNFNEVSMMANGRAAAAIVSAKSVFVSERHIKRYRQDTRWGIDFDNIGSELVIANHTKPNSFSSSKKNDGIGRNRKQGKPSYSIAASHPIHSIMPYIPFLNLICSSLSENGGWDKRISTKAAITSSEKQILPFLFRLLEYISEQISLILNIHEENPYLFVGPGIALLNDDGDDDDDDDNDKEILRISNMGEDSSKRTNILECKPICSGAQNVRQSVTMCRLALAATGEGASLLSKIYEENDTKNMNSSGSILFDCMVAQISSRERDNKMSTYLNDRGLNAAMKLDQIPSDHNTDDTQANSNSTQRTKIKEAPVVRIINDLNTETGRSLMKWTGNVSLILNDLNETNSVLSSNKNDMQYHLIQTTIPEVLSLKSLQGAETITSIAATYLSKKQTKQVQSNQGATDASGLCWQIYNKIAVLSWRVHKLMEAASRREVDIISFITTLNVTWFWTVLISTILLIFCFFLGIFSVYQAILSLISITFTLQFIPRESADHHPAFVSSIEKDFVPALPAFTLQRSYIQDKISSILSSRISNCTFSKGNPKGNVLLVCGEPCSGKTVISSLLIKNQDIAGLFRDGVVFISLENIDFTLENLYRLYRRICNQLCVVSSSRDLVGRASTFNTRQFFIQADDDSLDMHKLMDDLRVDFFDGLRLQRKSVLIVLDGLNDISHLKWFHADELESKYTTKNRPFQILVTTNTLTENVSLNHEIVQLPSMSIEEMKYLLKNELKDSDLNSEETHAWVSNISQSFIQNPLILRSIARLVTFLKLDSSQTNKLTELYDEGNHESDDFKKLCHIVRQFLSGSSSDGEGLGNLLLLCYAVFNSVFYENLMFSGFVPVRIVYIVWEELLNSEEVSSGALISLDQHVLAREQNGGGILSRSGFITECLVSLGFLSETSEKHHPGKIRVRGLFIENEMLRKFGLQYARNLYQSTHEYISESKRWCALVVQGYQELMSDVRTRVSRMRCTKSSREEDYFVLSHAIHHMIVAGSLEKACKLLMNTKFVGKRLQRLGILDGTLRQISDVEHLYSKMQSGFFSRRGNFDESFAKKSIISSFERLADNLDSLKVKSLERASVLYMLGHSLKKHGWYNEASALFHESLIISDRSIATKQQRSVLLHLKTRANYAVGMIFLEKDNFDDALISLSNSLKHPTPLENAKILGTKAWVLLKMKDYNKSLDCFNYALTEIKQNFGIDNACYASLLHNLGLAHTETGDLLKAKEYISQSLEIRRNLFGNCSESSCQSLHCLGEINFELGNYSASTEILKEAVNFWKIVVVDKPTLRASYANSLFILGFSFKRQGNLHESLEAYEAALQIRYTLFGSHHEETASTLHNIGIVYCELGMHEEAMTAYARALQSSRFAFGENDTSLPFQQKLKCLSPQADGKDAMHLLSNALWGTKSLHIKAPAVADIQQRCKTLFGIEIQSKPCSSARIFSCASIIVDHMVDNESQLNTKTETIDDSALKVWITTLMPLMTAIVKAEVIATENEKTTETAKVSFSTFDFSSVTVPVDMTLGSNVHLEHSITAICRVVESIERLRKRIEEDLNFREKTYEISKLLLVLHAMTSPREGEGLREACAKAMPSSQPWAPSRFFSAAQFYRAEFESIIAMMDLRRGTETFIPLSPFRLKLSTFVGFAIRFHLRRMFDPVPLAFTIPSEKHPLRNLSACRSKIHEIVMLVPPEGVQNKHLPKDKKNSKRPLWERPISKVLNLALQQLSIYFQMLPELRASYEVSESVGKDGKVSLSLTLRQASMRCLDGRSKERDISALDVEDILSDINLAHTCLSASRASRFILSLLRWPGVELAINNAGGWKNIESLSNILKVLKLDRDFPEEAHFVSLHNVPELINQLESHKVEMMTTGRASQRLLQEMWNRFKKGHGLKRQQTNDSIIRDALVDQSTTALFPQVAAAS